MPRRFPRRTSHGIDGDGFFVHTYAADIDASAELVTMDNTYAQLAATGLVRALSASAGDTTQSLYVRGVDTNDKIFVDTISLNGTDTVNSSRQYKYIDQVWLSAAAAGNVTLEDTSGTDIAVITAGRLESDVAQIFSGEKTVILEHWQAGNPAGGETLAFELRWYPDDASCLSAATGFMVLDRLYLPDAMDSDGNITDYKIDPGGWLAVYCTAGEANTPGYVNLSGKETTEK